jgi:3-oxoacyl-[acyl-carrier protein] reductase
MIFGKNIVVTGALKGIGKVAVERFAEQGAHLWACANFLTPEFVSFCSELSKKHQVRVEPLCSDFTDVESVKLMAKQILAAKVPVDGLVNIAGMTKDAVFHMTTATDLLQIYQVNVVSTLVLTQLLSKNMMRQKAGSIVNVSSIAATDGIAGQLAYASSKAALNGATRTLARELGSYGIRVNSIAPGVIDTDMNQNVPVDILKERISSTSLGRIGKPTEVVDLMCFLLSDLSSYLSGQIIRIDGGMA